jgi:hypothetical protein
MTAGMNRLFASITLALFAAGASGCIVHRRPVHSRTQTVVVKDGCRPNQYWDGSQCRHKGKGHGARKHDGR